MKSNTPLWDEFIAFASLTEGSASSYKSYLNSFAQRLDAPYDDFLSIVGTCLAYNEKTYALSIMDKVMAEAGNLTGNQGSALRKYHSFVKAYRGANASQAVSFSALKAVLDEEDAKMLSLARSLFKKSELHKIDAMESIAQYLGEEKFVKMAVESSYFFSASQVRSRFEDILRAIPGSLYAREGDYSRGEACAEFKDGGYLCAVQVDRDGNAEVRSLINAVTGYTVSQDEGSIFLNYKIFHVWGNASDPRFFTNLANLVIMPCWANDLMDKTGAAAGTLASRLRSTIMAICRRHYQIDSLPLEKLSLDKDSFAIGNAEDIVTGTYTLSVLGDKPDKHGTVGQINNVECEI